MGGYCCVIVNKTNSFSKKDEFIVHLPSPREENKNIFEEGNCQKLKSINKEIIEKNNFYENSNNARPTFSRKEVINVRSPYFSTKKKNENQNENEFNISDLGPADVYEILPDISSNSRGYYDDPFDSSKIISGLLDQQNKESEENKNSENKNVPYLKLPNSRELIKKRSNVSNRSNNNKIFNFSEEEASARILDQINEARLDPLKFSKKIQKYSKFIFEEKSTNKSYLSIDTGNEKVKIYLKKDKSSFLESINLLEELPEKMKKENTKFEKLIQMDELLFPFPIMDLDKIDDFDYIDICIEKIKKNIEGKCKLRAFHYYISFIDLEPLSVIHIVDDSNFDKTIQRAIFNPKVKYAGINFCKINEGVYIVYYVYAI